MTTTPQLRSGDQRAGIRVESGKCLGRYVTEGEAGQELFVIDNVAISQADPGQRIERLRVGFPADIVKELARCMRWSLDHTLTVMGVKRSTVMRKIKANARLATDESERILGVIDLIEQVRRMVERSDDLREFDVAAWLADWLESDNPSLGGKRPVDYLDTHVGIGIVRRLLAQMESGAYA